MPPSDDFGSDNPRDDMVETENFGVIDEGDHLEVYRKEQHEFAGKLYYVKIGELYRTVYGDGQMTESLEGGGPER